MVVLIALFAMICWGIAPIFGKLGLSDLDPLVGLAYRTYLSTALLTGWMIRDNTFSKMAGVSLKSIIFLGIEGILATLVGDLAYYAAIKYGEISIVTLIMSCSPIISIIMAILIFDEQLTPVKFVGAGLIVIGLTLIVR
ncbi:MAG TPA: EamA family transporter [Clostridia bacterium]|mgnify:CR=1 FL=1|nr:EamA family transporter [Clostridia bacterium]